MKYVIVNYIKNANAIIDKNIILEEFFIAILEITLKINKNGTVEKDCKYNIFRKDYNTQFYNCIISKYEYILVIYLKKYYLTDILIYNKKYIY